MTQKEKSLLLQDLCVRLPYGVMVNAQYKDDEGWKTDDRKLLGLYTDGQIYLDCVYTTIDCIKPYLRPMSSMTEEEKKEWYATFESVYDLVPGGDPYNEDDYDDNWHEEPGIESFDWLNAHHFDHRNLIEKKLALEAPDNMYK